MTPLVEGFCRGEFTRGGNFAGTPNAVALCMGLLIDNQHAPTKAHRSIPPMITRPTIRQLTLSSGAYLGFQVRGREVKGSGKRKSPSGVQGQSPGMGSGGRSLPKTEAFCV